MHELRVVHVVGHLCEQCWAHAGDELAHRQSSGGERYTRLGVGTVNLNLNLYRGAHLDSRPEVTKRDAAVLR